MFCLSYTTEFSGCRFNIDNEWGIEWPNTAHGTIVTQPCPGELDSTTGLSVFKN